MSDNQKSKMMDYYNQLLTVYGNLEVEVEKLVGEEKKLHNQLLRAVDKRKVMKIQEYIKNIKE